MVTDIELRFRSPPILSSRDKVLVIAGLIGGVVISTVFSLSPTIPGPSVTGAFLYRHKEVHRVISDACASGELGGGEPLCAAARDATTVGFWVDNMAPTVKSGER
jgi:hypothetical protein